ncbi:MAG: 4-(cytidine 5'-diphospho)-2-C-methyl-D-erythritol kinase [Chlamydiota bacterium]
MSQKFYSPAKINIFLHVLRRRNDGFHDIASLFQAIDLCDELNITFSEDDKFTCNRDDIPQDSSNLVIQARDLFRRKTGINTGLAIDLHKKIPAQAGLGGGSSNAATTLWALNEIAGRPATSSDLALWGAALGSDVPFFFSSGAAICSGRGESVTSVAALPSNKVWVIKPSIGLSTPAVYQALDPQKFFDHDHKRLLDEIYRGDYSHISNDLEAAALKLLPQLQDLKQQLVKGDHQAVFMTGSGTTFICLGGEEPSLLGEDVKVFEAGFITRRQDNWYYPNILLNA